MTQELKDTYLTGPEAARILRITHAGLAQLARQGKIPAVKMANRWLIPKAFLDEFAQTYEGKRGRPRTREEPAEPTELLNAITKHSEPVDTGAIPDAKGIETEGDFAVNVRVAYLDQNYDLEIYEKGEITEHARLIVARLKPKITSLPYFSFRWDYRYEHLNVDIHGVGDAEKDWFREGHQGYGGHIPRRLSDPERAFEANIWMPGTHVFRGRVSFVLPKYSEVEKEALPAATIVERFRKWRKAIGARRNK